MQNIIRLTEDMFKSGKPFAQGEVLIWMRKYAPKSVLDGVAKFKEITDLPLVNGMMVLGHGENGAHHVLEPVAKKVKISKAAQALIDAANDTFIDLNIFQECALVHKRESDQHGAVVLPPGEYIRGIREEQSVQGWVRVAD
jgi:hypothetical protein